MRYLSLILAVIICFLLSSCASKIDPVLEQVSTIEQAMYAFGPPHDVTRIPGGNTIYTWSRSRNVSIGGYPVYNPGYITTYTPVQNINLICELHITASSKGRVVDWVYSGNDCDSLILRESVNNATK